MLRIDKQHLDCLKDQAFVSEATKGRRDNPASFEHDFLDPFVADTVKQMQSKAWRRLGSKTQVFTNSGNIHVRTRATHTMEVVSAATIMAKYCGLNTDLAGAIAWGHDFGHVPYGHLGEDFIAHQTGRKFKHAAFSVVVLQKIERRGQGLNLSFEVLEGIRNHSGKAIYHPLPLEYSLVSMADAFSFIFADVNDIERLDFFDTTEMLERAKQFGETQRERLFSCIAALLRESAGRGTLSFERSDIAESFWQFQRWMYDNVYDTLNNYRKAQQAALEDAYFFLTKHPYYEGCEPAVLLALMTDTEVDKLIPVIRNRPNVRDSDLEALGLGINEIVPHIRGKEIDFIDPDLDWGK